MAARERHYDVVPAWTHDSPTTWTNSYERLTYGALSRVDLERDPACGGSNGDGNGYAEMALGGLRRPPVRGAGLAASAAWAVLCKGAPLATQTFPYKQAVSAGGALPLRGDGGAGTEPLGEADILEVARWIRTVAPRGPGDLKPLITLLQALLQDLLDEQIQFSCAELAAARNELRAERESFNARLAEAIERAKSEAAGAESILTARARMRAATGQVVAAIAVADDLDDEALIAKLRADLAASALREKELHGQLKQCKGKLECAEQDRDIARRELQTEQSVSASLRTQLGPYAQRTEAAEAEAEAVRKAAELAEAARLEAEAALRTALTNMHPPSPPDTALAGWTFDPQLDPDATSVTGKVLAAKTSEDAVAAVVALLPAESAAALSALKVEDEEPITAAIAESEPEELGEMAAHMVPSIAARSLGMVDEAKRGMFLEALARTSAPVAGAVCHFARLRGDVDVDVAIAEAAKVEEERESRIAKDEADARELLEARLSSHVEDAANTEAAARMLDEALEAKDEDPTAAAEALSTADAAMAAAILCAEPSGIATAALERLAGSGASGYIKASDILSRMASSARLRAQLAAPVDPPKVADKDETSAQRLISTAQAYAARIPGCGDEDDVLAILREFAEVVPSRTGVLLRIDLDSMVDDDDDLEEAGGADLVEVLAGGDQRAAARLRAAMRQSYKKAVPVRSGTIMVEPMVAINEPCWGVITWDVRSADVTSAQVRLAMEILNQAIAAIRHRWRDLWETFEHLLEEDVEGGSIVAFLQSRGDNSLAMAPMALRGLGVNLARKLMTHIDELAEVKSYVRPTDEVMRTVASGLVAIGAPGVKQGLAKKATDVVTLAAAEEGREAKDMRVEQWRRCKRGLVTRKTKKGSLITGMRDLLRCELEELLEPATSKRLTLAKALVGRVTHAEAVDASRPIGYLRKWCVALGMQHEIAEHIQKEAEVNGTAMPRIFGPDG